MARLQDFKINATSAMSLGKVIVSDPNVDRPGFKDHYVFEHYFNGEELVPYHGGVNYGKNLGKAGYYPDLNWEEVQTWWGEQYKKMIELGLEFIWQVMTSSSIAKEYGDTKSCVYSTDVFCHEDTADRAKIPCRLLLSPQTDGQPKQPAIEIWSLYAYSLHKATFKGLNNSAKRKGKRNFIIGRGSFSGIHRFAGLWTGDNTGTWDFLNISVAQALALGLSGMTIVGGDVGGFMPSKPKEEYTEPELLIRWLAACFLLPWFWLVFTQAPQRPSLLSHSNHYNGKPEQKLFQVRQTWAAHLCQLAQVSGTLSLPRILRRTLEGAWPRSSFHLPCCTHCIALFH